MMEVFFLRMELKRINAVNPALSEILNALLTRLQ